MRLKKDAQARTTRDLLSRLQRRLARTNSRLMTPLGSALCDVSCNTRCRPA